MTWNDFWDSLPKEDHPITEGDICFRKLSTGHMPDTVERRILWMTDTQILELLSDLPTCKMSQVSPGELYFRHESTSPPHVEVGRCLDNNNVHCFYGKGPTSEWGELVGPTIPNGTIWNLTKLAKDSKLPRELSGWLASIVQRLETEE